MNAATVVIVAAVAAGVAAPALAGQTTSPALLDPHLTIGAGATISTTLADGIARAEHEIVPDQLLAGSGMLRRSGNVTFRLLKLAFFDAPQEQLLMVVNHEVFGHGARLRERFDGPIGYRIGVPQPYGRGGGSTSFAFDRQPSRHEVLAINVAGMEASAVSAGLVAHHAFSRDALRMRDALRYLLFELDTLSYVLSTDDAGEGPGHDVAGFLETYNAIARGSGGSELTIEALRRQTLASLANPMLGYALYGIGRYVWRGAAETAVPALSIAGVRYLPLLRYRLAPYGVEWALINELGGRMRPTQIELRIGRAPQSEPWGIGVRQHALITWRQWSMDAAVDIWRQPRLTAETDRAAGSETSVGAQLRGRVSRPLIPVWFSPARLTIVVDVSFKTAGFVPGEPLDRGIVARAGIGLPFGS